MVSFNFDRKFLESTRGRIILLLRRNDLTVNSLAAELGLTDNAVRAHLLSLERDGLVAQQGMIKGVRKPHYIYGLSEYARGLFPRPYGLLFIRLLSSLRNALSPTAFLERMRDIGFGIGQEQKSGADTILAERVDRALGAIEALGGNAVVSNAHGQTVISSTSCPFAEAVAEHPEVCKVTESMLAEILETEVTESCDRTSAPKCRFQVRTT